MLRIEATTYSGTILLIYSEGRCINMNKMQQIILREQLAEHKETARKIWKIYHDEMTRLIENPDSQPDSSVLERFIENESGTFGQELAKIFKDAIEYGFAHAGFVSEV